MEANLAGTFRYRVEHETRYVHTARASTSQHVAHLTPRSLPHQVVLSHHLDVDPAPAEIASRVDYFGNIATYFAVLTPYVELRATSRSLVEVTSAGSAVDSEASRCWEDVRDLLTRGEGASSDGVEYRYPSPYITLAPELAAFALRVFTPRRPLLAAAIDLMHVVHREFRFDPGSTSIATPVTRILTDQHGVCQDFAHLSIACLRSIGLAARYVSGYMLTDPPPGQARLIGADASHAWLAVWCPDHHWVDLDPTNDLIPGVRHVTVAWGRDYSDVSPLRGVVLGGQDHALRVAVSVTPVSDEGAPALDVG